MQTRDMRHLLAGLVELGKLGGGKRLAQLQFRCAFARRVGGQPDDSANRHAHDDVLPIRTRLVVRSALTRAPLSERPHESHRNHTHPLAVAGAHKTRHALQRTHLGVCHEPHRSATASVAARRRADANIGGTRESDTAKPACTRCEPCVAHARAFAAHLGLGMHARAGDPRTRCARAIAYERVGAPSAASRVAAPAMVPSVVLSFCVARAHVPP